MNDMTNGRQILTRNLASVEPIPAEGIARAGELMRSGNLFRYGEYGSSDLEAAALEKEFAAYIGLRYAVGLNSCGCSLFVALKCAGVNPGDKVLMNSFTLAPVPGSVAHAGAQTVLVESTGDLLIDLDDLKIKAACGARVLLLSHMRGHIADMDAVAALCDELHLTLIEDCAHTLGAKWNGRPTGTFGAIGCFSAQAYKHVNAGEGGLLVTDDEDIAAQAILYSGSYMLYGQHTARPPLEVFERHKDTIPNFSMRMSNLAAAVVRPQLRLLAERAVKWNERHDLLAAELAKLHGITLPRRGTKEAYVASSIQFSVTGLTYDQMFAFVDRCGNRGVQLKWFGRREPVGFTSRYKHWQYIAGGQSLPKTEAILARLCDMRIPTSLTLSECHTIVAIIRESLVSGTRASRVMHQ
jgi:dTDP-4-amino-4,6-dideoxygalactose transaminase